MRQKTRTLNFDSSGYRRSVGLDIDPKGRSVAPEVEFEVIRKGVDLGVGW
jgi:hypothetical protein